MFNFLRKLFFPAAPPNPSATSEDRSAFLRNLKGTDIFVIVGSLTEGFDPTDMTSQQLLDRIKHEAEQLSALKEFIPSVYTKHGQTRLPFFTSMDHAQTFAAVYSKEHNRVFPLQMIGASASLLGNLASTGATIVMNDSSPDEVAFTPQEILDVFTPESLPPQ
jgi:hypothetical protein